jgi:hypothetical protein
MKQKKQSPSLLLFALAMLVLLSGLLLSAWKLSSSGVWMYPSLIADAYREQQHRLRLPGSEQVKLTRSGAYGIYYEYSLVSSIAEYPDEIPPAIECSLTSLSSGAKLEAAPDYVPTNRYWSNEEGGFGVLIMSITVDQPDTYHFACSYLDGSTRPEIVVALGPNYFWEFLRVAWEIIRSLLGGVSIFCGSVLLALVMVIIMAAKRRISPQQDLV